ncbi:MAG: helix-turn-helix domain-containing protein [Halobacteria archaeon]|nr:helix-turn-helix domain-containing protein [Halobacteria archaeon]
MGNKIEASQTKKVELSKICEALQDPKSRFIVKKLVYEDEPLDAKKIAEKCSMPLSTTYRKLDALTESSLVEKQTEIRKDGKHTQMYELDFRDFVVSLEKNGEEVEFEAEITPSE